MQNWLEILAWIGLIVAFLCALFILWDIYIAGHRQKMTIMEAVWPITALYLGVVGVWAYWTMGRETSNSPEKEKSQYRQSGPVQTSPTSQKDRENSHSHSNSKEKPFWQKVFVSVCHCGGGCTLGDIIGEWGIFLLGFTIAGSALWSAYLVDFILALALGIVFQYFAIVPMRHYGFIEGLKEASKADFLSLAAFEVGLFGWMALMHFVFFDPPLEPDSPIYWFMMQIGMAIGFLTSYPMNWFLVKKGIKEAM
jgi:hypothetical protein